MLPKAKIKNTQLLISLPLQEPILSKSSGKTLVIASSRGLQPSEATFDGKPVYFVGYGLVYPDKSNGHQDRAEKRKRAK